MSKAYTTKEKRIRNTKYAAIALAVILVVSGVFFMISLWENKKEFFPEQNTFEAEENIRYKGREYKLKEDVESVLVLGLDKFEGADAESYNNDKQSDFLMLFVLDHKNESCTALHINRDTMAEMAVLGVAGDKIGTVTKQIALAHTYGNGKEVSCRNAADAVSDLLMGISVDHYVSVTMDAVSVYNDFIGGVELTVLDDFEGIDETLVKGETVTLKGEHALNYVRTRYGLDNSTNARRMVRQRQYLEALYTKSAELIKSDESFVVNAGMKLADYIVSDYSGNGLQSLAKQISEYQFVEICELEGRITEGEEHIEFYPDEDSIEETVIRLFYESVE